MVRYERMDVDPEPADLRKAGGKYRGGIGSLSTLRTKGNLMHQTKTTKTKRQTQKVENEQT